ncbi:MAG TPA: hypothetical protein VMM85_05165, partial [Methylomirabilota bacterium]|nr:hypothetical protein [Methylomirabilota bacterium]
GRLGAGERFFVVDGPTPADGYNWYLAAPLRRADGTAAPFGWIASAHRDGTHWVEPDPSTCGGDDDLAAVVALQGLERLACFGNASLTLPAPEISCGAGGGPIVYEPSWLAAISGCGVVVGDSALLLRIPPGYDGSIPSSGAWEISGHFDDPTAALCTASSLDPAIAAPPAEAAVLHCRTEFVLESAASG